MRLKKREIQKSEWSPSSSNHQARLLDTPHSLFPVCRDTIDKVLGVVRAKDFLDLLDNNVADIETAIKPLLNKQQPVFVCPAAEVCALRDDVRCFLWGGQWGL